MTCGTFTIEKIPDEDLQNTIDLFNANTPPPISVTSKPDGVGTNTVIAVFPPCPNNTTHAISS